MLKSIACNSAAAVALAICAVTAYASSPGMPAPVPPVQNPGSTAFSPGMPAPVPPVQRPSLS